MLEQEPELCSGVEELEVEALDLIYKFLSS